jgi:PD-(D/E)XK nuclease superfamily
LKAPYLEQLELKLAERKHPIAHSGTHRANLMSSSYSLWSSFEPAAGMEQFHCHRKRGYFKVRNKEPEVAPFLQLDNLSQSIGKLAQAGVWHLHNLGNRTWSRGEVAGVLHKMNLPKGEVGERVEKLIYRYAASPWLRDKRLHTLNRGDEKYSPPTSVRSGQVCFNLYAAFDCLVEEPSGRLTVVDFKTGRSKPDRRQALVYLVALTQMKKQAEAAVFLNLETGDVSNPIRATKNELEAVRIQLGRIANKHKQQVEECLAYPEKFDEIYPANPGKACRSCPFAPICQYSSYPEAS